MEPLFKSFISAGFECTSALAQDKRRLNLLGQTRHDDLCLDDYALMNQNGFLTVREGLSWNAIDQGAGVYDFSRYIPLLEAAQRHGIQQIWDLNHFDYPFRLDPFSKEFIEAFAKHAQEFIKLWRSYSPTETLYVVPINEISFFAWIGADMGWWAPYKKGRRNGGKLKAQLVRAAIAAMDAIWEVDDNVRFIQVDPFMRRVAKQPQPVSEDTTAAAPPIFPPSKKALAHIAEFNDVVRFEAWDLLSGRKKPELGGDPKYLDIIGMNYYIHNQEWVITGEKDTILHQLIDWDSPDRVPFAEMIRTVHDRYQRPIFISETGSFGTRRGEWWQRTLAEIDDALAHKLPIVGVCAYPILDRPESAGFLLPNSGVWDFDPADSLCQRMGHQPSLTAIGHYHDRWRSLGLQT
jgi:beta-glucosidase/6-phospho-beta-glucosidase/beta-galactosidase